MTNQATAHGRHWMTRGIKGQLYSRKVLAVNKRNSVFSHHDHEDLDYRHRCLDAIHDYGIGHRFLGVHI